MTVEGTALLACAIIHKTTVFKPVFAIQSFGDRLGAPGLGRIVMRRRDDRLPAFYAVYHNYLNLFDYLFR
jgi:hypothetical protein